MSISVWPLARNWQILTEQQNTDTDYHPVDGRLLIRQLRATLSCQTFGH